MLHIEDHGVPESQFYKNNKRKILECLVWKRKFQTLRKIMEENDVTPPGLEVEPCPDWAVKGNFLESIERYFIPKYKDLEQNLKFKADEISQLNKEVERSHVLRFYMNIMNQGEVFLDDD